jgi:hypothetical protein
MIADFAEYLKNQPDVMIFVDTCSLMQEDSREVFIRMIQPLSKNNKKVYITTRVEQDLRSISANSTKRKRDAELANQGFEIIQELYNHHVAVHYDSLTEGHKSADTLFLMIFSQLREKYPLCLITNDFNLSLDIFNLQKAHCNDNIHEFKELSCWRIDKVQFSGQTQKTLTRSEIESSYTKYLDNALKSENPKEHIFEEEVKLFLLKKIVLHSLKTQLLPPPNLDHISKVKELIIFVFETGFEQARLEYEQKITEISIKAQQNTQKISSEYEQKITEISIKAQQNIETVRLRSRQETLNSIALLLDPSKCDNIDLDNVIEKFHFNTLKTEEKVRNDIKNKKNILKLKKCCMECGKPLGFFSRLFSCKCD